MSDLLLEQNLPYSEAGELPAPDLSEVLRYLGYRKQIPEDEVLEEISGLTESLRAAVTPRAVYRIAELSIDESGALLFSGVRTKSRALYRNLRGCSHVLLFAATLGAEPDRLLAKEEIRSMSRAMTLQSVATALIEIFCDRLSAYVAESLSGIPLYPRPRFSPGYGDLPLSLQPSFLSLLETTKRIGLRCTDSLLLTPTKSVTAIQGLSSGDLKCFASGCEICPRTDCAFRHS